MSEEIYSDYVELAKEHRILLEKYAKLTEEYVKKERIRDIPPTVS